MTTALWILVGIVLFYAAVLIVGYRARGVRITPPAERNRHTRALNDVGRDADRIWRDRP